MKKQCREEKARLDKELERITKKNEELMQAEQAEFLA